MSSKYENVSVGFLTKELTKNQVILKRFCQRLSNFDKDHVAYVQSRKNKHNLA